jgi:hypothetical protein
MILAACAITAGVYIAVLYREARGAVEEAERNEKKRLRGE